MKLPVILFFCIILAIINEAIGNHHHEHSGQAAGKHEKGGKKFSQFKHLKKSGKKSAHDEEKAKKGQVLKELHKKDDEEAGGKKTTHHSEGGHQAVKSLEGASAHGAKFEEGKKLKKTNFKKGFREKYHKDEHKKHDSFYSNGQKSGDFELFGEKHSKYGSHHSAKKAKDNHKTAKHEDDYRKQWLKLGGHDAQVQTGHQDEKATKSHHNRQEKFAKKGGKKGGKQYKYKVPPHK